MVAGCAFSRGNVSADRGLETLEFGTPGTPLLMGRSPATKLGSLRCVRGGWVVIRRGLLYGGVVSVSVFGVACMEAGPVGRWHLAPMVDAATAQAALAAFDALPTERNE